MHYNTNKIELVQSLLADIDNSWYVVKLML